MFFNAISFNQPLNTWDVSNVTKFGGPFFGDEVFYNTPFNQPLDNWDVSSGTDFRRMFGSATSFNQDISMWNVSSATNMERMFFDADAFDQDLSAWDITSVSNFLQFMSGATGLSTVNYDALLVGWEATLQATWSGGAGYPYTINVNFGGSQYSSALMNVGEARYNLINVFGWTITDGGAV